MVYVYMRIKKINIVNSRYIMQLKQFEHKCKYLTFTLYQFNFFLHNLFIHQIYYFNYDKNVKNIFLKSEKTFLYIISCYFRTNFVDTCLYFCLFLSFLIFLTNIGFSCFLLRLRFICAALFLQIATNLVNWCTLRTDAKNRRKKK